MTIPHHEHRHPCADRPPPADAPCGCRAPAARTRRRRLTRRRSRGVALAGLLAGAISCGVTTLAEIARVLLDDETAGQDAPPVVPATVTTESWSAPVACDARPARVAPTPCAAARARACEAAPPPTPLPTP